MAEDRRMTAADVARIRLSLTPDFGTATGLVCEADARAGNGRKLTNGAVEDARAGERAIVGAQLADYEIELVGADLGLLGTRSR